MERETDREMQKRGAEERKRVMKKEREREKIKRR